jgi:hypothetical protein
MFSIGAEEGLIIGLILALFVAMFWGVIDAIRRPNELFVAADRSKAAWIIIQLFLFPLGSILYWAIAWPTLNRKIMR